MIKLSQLVYIRPIQMSELCRFRSHIMIHKRTTSFPYFSCIITIKENGRVKIDTSMSAVSEHFSFDPLQPF